VVQTAKQKFKAGSWTLMLGLSGKHHPASRIGKELDWNMPGVEMDFNLFNGSLRQTVNDKDSNGWSDPGGKGFMVRSRTYDQDSLKVCAFATSNPYPFLLNHQSDIDRI
jgi:hypothetical protein